MADTSSNSKKKKNNKTQEYAKRKKRDTTSKELWFAAGLPKRAAEEIEKRKKTLDSI